MNLSIQILPRRHFQEPCCVDRQTLPLLCKSSPSKDEVSIKWRLHEDINLMRHALNRLSVFFVGPIAHNLTPTWWAILSGYWISIRSQGDSINFFDHNAITWIRNALSGVPYILGKLRPPLWACFEWDETQRKNLANDCSLGIMRWKCLEGISALGILQLTWSHLLSISTQRPAIPSLRLLKRYY